MSGTLRKKSWALILVVMVVGILVFDFFTKGVDFVARGIRVAEKISAAIIPPPSPSVRLGPTNKYGGECLEFVFTNLPDDFSLGDIRLGIVQTSGPAPFSGDMAAKIEEWTVNVELPPSVFSEDVKAVIFRASFRSERNSDAAYIDFCPILAVPGVRGEMQIIPSFFSPSGALIENIEIVVHGGVPDGSIVIDLSHPKNVSLSHPKNDVRPFDIDEFRLER